MKLVSRGALILSGLFVVSVSFAQKKKSDLTKFVDPFIGTGGHGHTYPGAVMPFGMVQLSPDTRLEGWDGCSGYHYTDTVVYGFSHTHLSGTGIPDLCDVLFMPTTGEPKFKNTDYRSGFKKKNESATPGYYHTLLDKYNIGVELTSTARVGVHKYEYNGAKEGNIIIDLQHRDEVLDSWIEVVNDHEIRGFRRSKSWATDQHVYFYAKFSKPFKSYGIALNDELQSGKNKVEGKNVKMYIQFDNPGDVISKVGISSVSTEGALKNLDAEVSDFDFKKVAKAAKLAWSDELNKIQVEGGAPSTASQNQMAPTYSPYGYNQPSAKSNKKQPTPPDYGKLKKIMFYSALYHCFSAPSLYNDVDGQYRGMDNKIHKAEGFNYYTAFSLWDTYRAENPLLNIIDRKRTLDFIKSFLAMYEQDGVLPIWPLATTETFCMVGNHSIPVIVDAYAKGIRDFNAEEAFTAMKASVNRKQFGLDNYAQTGAVQSDVEHESAAKTLDYAIDDWCIAQMAKMLNKPEDYKTYIKRAQYWKNLHNNQNGFMQARENGGWYVPFEPTEINNNYTEGNAWQYSFLVPQDVEGLAKSLGGADKLEKKLDELFTTTSKLSGRQQDDVTGLVGQYAHGNEPSHHIAYLYNFTNASYKTQYYVNKLLREQYSAQPDGLSGNEDCGQMSAWYVISSLGLYNVMPGQNQFQITLPQFEKITLNLENGKTFTISNPGATVNRNNFYIQGMNLDKKPYAKLYLNYEDLAKGGEFEVFSGTLANKLFMQELEKPTSKITDELIIPNPYITGSKTFKQPIAVEIGCADADAKIYYTIDGSSPTAQSTPYTKPFPVAETTTVKAIAIKDGNSSFVDEAIFKKIRSDIKISIINKYQPNYSAQGDETLINGIHGTPNWRIGNWQGYTGKDVEVVLDLEKMKPVEQLSFGALQDTRSWIVFPKTVEYWLSDDGKNYKLAATVNTKVAPDSLEPQTQEYTAPIGESARYIKVVAKQYGPLPEWHESKGSLSYIFADEITID
ncbi:MAG: GH92 family glycosyl hydrolase [Mucilaginibacter sp.]|nr:GH92 family glycosyl hydrolase [Mucilaginibacter sp.]